MKKHFLLLILNFKIKKRIFLLSMMLLLFGILTIAQNKTTAIVNKNVKKF